MGIQALLMLRGILIIDLENIEVLVIFVGFDLQNKVCAYLEFSEKCEKFDKTDKLFKTQISLPLLHKLVFWFICHLEG